MATPRQMRWATLMSEFDFAIKYTPGDKNVAADALSRGAAGGAPPDVAEAGTAEERLLINRIAMIAPMPVRVRAAAEMDDDYQAILACSSEYLRTKKLAKADGLLYRATGYEDSGQLVVPANRNLRAWMLSWSHDAVESGHRGAQRMYEWLRTRVWWPGMQADAEKYARGCESCQQNKPDVQGRQGMPLSIDTPTRAGEVICMDFIGPFIPSGREKWDSIMVVVDKLTRYCMYIPMRTTSAAPEVFHALDQRWMADIWRAERHYFGSRFEVHIALLGADVGRAARRTQTQHLVSPANGRDYGEAKSHTGGSAEVFRQRYAR